ncbi:MAG: peptidyl-tRNA hydrolase Pth2 [Candidatus Aenigmatarchaeota archaeon]|nr:peptidyl-tRNA hydrolase Pth2 [Candidatus Aenigmarchaeota archaeon]
MYKQVIVLRKDLKMSTGKAAAQAAHASLKAVEKARKNVVFMWNLVGAKKVVLAAENESQLKEIYENARKAKLPCSIIKDAGKTHLKPGTLTAVAIGPDNERKIDEITGKLKML